MSLANTNLTQLKTSQVVISNKITEKDIIITPIITTGKILDVYFNTEIGYVKTEKETKIEVYATSEMVLITFLEEDGFKKVIDGEGNDLELQYTEYMIEEISDYYVHTDAPVLCPNQIIIEKKEFK